MKSFVKKYARFLMAISFAFIGFNIANAATSDITDDSRLFLINYGDLNGGAISAQGGGDNLNAKNGDAQKFIFQNNDNFFQNSNSNVSYSGKNDYHVIVYAKASENNITMGVGLNADCGISRDNAKYTELTTDYAYYDLGAISSFSNVSTANKYRILLSDGGLGTIYVRDLFITTNPGLYIHTFSLTATTIGASKVALEWDAVTGATNYTIYKSTDGGTTWDAGTSTGNVTAYTVSGLTANTAYTFKVTNNSTSDTDTTSSTTEVTPVLSVTHTGTTANLTWTYAGGGTPTFVVLRSTDGVNFSQVATTTGTSYSNTGLTIGTTYHYKVAVQRTGEPLKFTVGATEYIDRESTSSYNGWQVPTCIFNEDGTPASNDADRNVVAAHNISGWAKYNAPAPYDGMYKLSLWFSTSCGHGTSITLSKDAENTQKMLSMTAANHAPIERTCDSGDYWDTYFKFPATILLEAGDNNYYLHNGGYTNIWQIVFTTWTQDPSNMVSVTPLAAPSITATANSASQITVNWAAVTNATSYEVYRSIDNVSFSSVGTQTFPFSNSGLSANTTYYYKVKAKNASGESDFSNVSQALTYLAAPTGVTTAPDCSRDGYIIVSWNTVAGADSYSIEAYGNSQWNDKGTGITNTSYAIQVFGGYTDYRIHVKAVNSNTSSEWSEETTGKPRKPAPALSISGTTDNSVALSYTGTYDVYRSAYVDGNYKLLASGQSNGYTDNAVFSGSKYYYKLNVTDATCGTRWSNSVNTTTTHTLGVPVPRIKSKDVAKVTIEWNAVAGAGGYRIYRSTNNINYDFIGLTNETTYTDDVNNGCNGYMSKHKTYFYKITAVEEGLEQWFYTGDVDYKNCTPEKVMEKALYTGRSETSYCSSWKTDGGGYKFINGEVYKTKNDGKYNSCGTMSDGYAWFSNAVSTAGEYRLEAFVALNTGTTDVWMSANLANAADAADSTKAYVFFDNIVPLPRVEANCDNGSWQNYYPYEGALALNAGDNTIYYSIKGGQNVLKYTLSRGESDLSLAVAVEFIPAPSISAEATSITNARITWAKIEGADYYKIRYKDFTENKTTTEGIGWTDWELMPTANDTVYNFTINPTHQYRYQVKSFVGTIDNTPIAESAVANNYASARDYAPQVRPTATSESSVRLKIIPSDKTKVTQINKYTLYYTTDKINGTWSSTDITRSGTDTLVYDVTGLKPATVYFFKATATVGEYTSMESTPMAVITKEATPTLTFTEGVLTWTSVPDATEYRIYRRVTAGSGDFANIATVSGNTTYIDRSATGGYGYTYKVAAVSPHGEIFEQWAYDKSGNGQYVAREKTDQWGTDGNNNKYYEGVPFDTKGRYTAGNTGTYLKFSVQSHYNATYKVETYLARNDVNIGNTNYLHSEYTGVKPADPYADFSGKPSAGPCFGMDNGWQNYRSFEGNIPMTAAAQNVYLVGGGINFMKMVFWVNDVMAEGTASDTVAVTTPPVITDIECYGGNSVTINWTYNETADKYYIYRCATENGEYEKIGESTTKSYTDNITLGNTYYYKVSAVTGGGTGERDEIDLINYSTNTNVGGDLQNSAVWETNASENAWKFYSTNSTDSKCFKQGISLPSALQNGNATSNYGDYYIVANVKSNDNSEIGVLFQSNQGNSTFTNALKESTSTDYKDVSVGKIRDFNVLLQNTFSIIMYSESTTTEFYIKRIFITNTIAPSFVESDKSASMAGGCTTMADTIIWTGSAATDAWNDIDNWDIIENGETRAIEASDAFGTPLTVIMPAELGTPTFDGGLGRINAASDIVLAYGALFDMDGFEDASGVCHSLTTSLVVRGEDRGEWILAGPNLKMKEGDGTREQLSGDYYLDKLPWVYMHEISIVQGDNPTISWQNAFPQLTKVLTPESAFAIRVDNKYGKYGINSERYYSKDSVKKHLGEQDVTFTFTGVPYPTPTFSVPDSKWTVVTNTKTANISVADLTNGEGGQVAVWNFNSGSAGNKGSWTTYTNSTSGVDTAFVIPATAFLYYNNSGAAKTADQLLAYTDYTQSGKYHVTAALDGVPDPTLTLTAANGKYAAQTSVTYNAFISDEETEEPTNNALKVFSSYDGVPDICSYNGGTAYFSRTVNGSTTTVPLGVSATSDMTFTLTAQGAENFKAAVLDDRLTGLSYNLKTQATLEFDIEAGENKDRFFLNLEYDDTLQPTTDIDENAADDITVTCNDKRIIIKSAGADLRKVRIADAAGRSTKTDASGRMEIIDMNGYANGVYIVTVWTKNGTKTERIIVK